MYVILELDVDTQGMIQSIGNGYKPTRQTTHNATAVSGYKRADRIKFGKSHLSMILICVTNFVTRML